MTNMTEAREQYRDTPEELPEYTEEGADPRAFEKTFRELVAGIIFSGTVFLAVLWFAFPDRRMYHISGLIIGTVLSLIMSFYLKSSVSNAISVGEYGAEKVIKKGALIRYGIVCIVIGVLMIWPVANPLTAFLGVMTLKVAAYIQPFTNRIFRKN